MRSFTPTQLKSYLNFITGLKLSYPSCLDQATDNPELFKGLYKRYFSQELFDILYDESMAMNLALNIVSETSWIKLTAEWLMRLPK